MPRAKLAERIFLARQVRARLVEVRVGSFVRHKLSKKVHRRDRRIGKERERDDGKKQSVHIHRRVFGMKNSVSTTALMEFS